MSILLFYMLFLFFNITITCSNIKLIGIIIIVRQIENPYIPKPEIKRIYVNLECYFVEMD